VALFAAAFVLLYLGLGLGLQYDATIGTACWLGAVVLVGLNVFWMHRIRCRSESK
jgi:putative Mn2+ efflux pump MntP